MAVAMKDLEIRGSGNLLGGEQSGHIAGVGFDLYVRLVGEAVADFRARRRAREAESAEVKVDLPVDANLPVDYLPGERLRLEAYRVAGRRPRPTRRSTRCAPSCSTATARCRPRSRTCSPWRGSRWCAAATASPRCRCRAARSGSRPVELPESAQLRLRAAVRHGALQAGGVDDRRAASEGRDRSRTGRSPRCQFGGEPLRDVALLAWCAQVLEQVTGH